MKKGFRILKFKKDRPIFEVKDLSKSFDGRPILKKLSLKESMNLITEDLKKLGIKPTYVCKELFF